MSAFRSVVVLSGGVGGARLVHGLAQVLEPDALSVVVNTGDDFQHWGLWVCPDLDTVMYTLARLSDDERGWGLRGETFAARAAIERYGGPTWFALGDRDLGTHLLRTQGLSQGRDLTQITRDLARALGVDVAILPMADEPRPTRIRTLDGQELGFQEWFVRERCPGVAAVESLGTQSPAPAALAALEAAELVLIGPSNPYVSIDPILGLDRIYSVLRDKLVVAVSPIVHGRAVKGPLAEMLTSVSGMRPGAEAVLRYYERRYPGLLTGFVVATGDEPETLAEGDADVAGGSATFTSAHISSTDVVMHDLLDRARLARFVLDFAGSLA